MKNPTIFHEKTRKGHHDSDEHSNCFKDNTGKTFETWGGVHI